MLKLNHVFLYAWTLGSHCIAYNQNTNFYHKLTHIYHIYMITSKMFSYGFPNLSTFLMICAHFWLDDKAPKRAKPSLPSKPFKANRHRVMRFGSIKGNEKRMYRPGLQKSLLVTFPQRFWWNHTTRFWVFHDIPNSYGLHNWFPPPDLSCLRLKTWTNATHHHHVAKPNSGNRYNDFTYIINIYIYKYL